jgi:hypothetical protein
MASPVDFSGKWALDHKYTTGDLEGCMRALGRSSMEIALLRKASEVQLLQHYCIGMVHAVQQHVTYCVLHVANFEWESRFAMNDQPIKYAADEKKFGDYTTQSALVENGRAFRVIWRMSIRGRDTTMIVTRRYRPDADLVDVHMHIEQQGLQQPVECCKTYSRQSRSDKEKEKMKKMRAGNENHCYMRPSSTAAAAAAGK